MKKITAIILVTLACVLMLSSCALVTPGALELAEKYDAAGYSVELIVDDDEIEDELTVEMRPEFAEAIVEVTSSDKKISGAYIYYNNTDSAKAAVEAIEALMANEETADEYADVYVTRQGKLVFFGMEDCWKAMFK